MTVEEARAALLASHEQLAAVDDAFFNSALAHGLDSNASAALTALRDALDFLQQAALDIASGEAFDGPKVLRLYQWAIMKCVELDAMLPEGSRAGLRADCFRRKARKSS